MLMFMQEKDIKSLFAVFILSTPLLLSGCASNELIEADAEVIEVEVSETDPYENFNRKIFTFNETLDAYVAEPVSDAYLWVTPQFFQTGVANFFNNLKDINVVLNDVMQGKFEQGGQDSGRFAVNSTLGLLGLFDVASEFGLEKHEEDFAQTLAVWGVPQGPYLVLPLIGPSTSRGVPGGIFDAAANPASYVGLPVQLIQMLNTRANAEGALNFIDEAALDPYVFTRESFLQYRKHLVTDGESEVTDDLLDEFGDEFDEDDELIDAQINDRNTTIYSDKEKVPSSTSDNHQVQSTEDSAGHVLKLSSDVDKYEKSSDSFESAEKSFEKASQSFEESAK